MNYQHVSTPVLQILIFTHKDGTVDNLTFTQSHQNFEEAAALSKSLAARQSKGKKIKQKHLEQAQDLFEIARVFTKWSNGQLVVEGDTVQYKGTPVAETVQEYLLDLMSQNKTDNFEGWSNFLEALNRSASFKVVNRLFLFLKKKDLRITQTGEVLAWKVVRPDLRDKYSGTNIHTDGAVISMDRSGVDDDDSRTCSHGLHVCSWGYLPSFANSSDTLVLVKVRPEDIIAIPLDYNGEKVRTCRYEVVKSFGRYGDHAVPPKIEDSIAIEQ